MKHLSCQSMSISSSAVYALAAYAAVATLGGCGGPQAQFSPLAPIQQNVRQSGGNSNVVLVKPLASLGGEVFKASNVHIRAAHCSKDQIGVFFNASGTAAGPYPGTFTAPHGRWEFYHPRFGAFWTFRESFTITSGANTISGVIRTQHISVAPRTLTCTSLGPVDGYGLVWRAGSGLRGSATILKIKKDYLKEKLY